MKFIPNFCDAVFEILDQHPDYDSLVFDALVNIFFSNVFLLYCSFLENEGYVLALLIVTLSNTIKLTFMAVASL